MDQQPKIPTLKDSQRPQVKVRGMSIGLTLAERLKQFKKKDLAFILAGLGVLFMAPLAEHFMMAPESADGSLQPGWSGRGGAGGASGVFGGGGSPYDRTDGLAPGSPTGGGSDVITPLNVRDPSALVMGPGAAQQPPTNSALPATPPAGSSRSDSDLKDALAASARGIGAAAKKASLPVPKVALGGSGLRGLGVAGGGSSASASLGPISAGNVPNRAAGGDSTGNVRSTKGYSGVARGQTSGGGGMDALKAAADKQADNINRGTGAATDLNAAAQTAIPSGGSGGAGGGPGSGKEDKGFGGNQDKGSKSVGESLDFLNKKARMEKDLELEYKKKELDDFGLLWGQMRNEGLKTFFGETVKAVTGVWTEGLKGALTPAGSSIPGWRCSSDNNATFYAASEGYKLISGNLYGPKGLEGQPLAKGCFSTTQKGKEEEKKDDGKGQVVDSTDGGKGGTSQGNLAKITSLGDVCDTAESSKTEAPKPAASAKGGVPATVAGIDKTDIEQRAWFVRMGEAAAKIGTARQALSGDPMPGKCVVDPKYRPTVTTPVRELQDQALDAIAGVGTAKSADNIIAKVKAGANTTDKADVSTLLEKAGKFVTDSDSALAYIKQYSGADMKAESGIPDTEAVDDKVFPLTSNERKLADIYTTRVGEARKALKTLYDELGKESGVQKDLDGELFKVQIKAMAGTGGSGGVHKVIEQNAALDTLREDVKTKNTKIAGLKTELAGEYTDLQPYMGMVADPAPLNPVAIVDAVTTAKDSSNKDATAKAIESAGSAIKGTPPADDKYVELASRAMVAKAQELKATAEGKASDKLTTATAAAETARDEQLGKANQASESSKTSVETMRGNLVGWADAQKKVAEALAQRLHPAAATAK